MGSEWKSARVGWAWESEVGPWGYTLHPVSSKNGRVRRDGFASPVAAMMAAEIELGGSVRWEPSGDHEFNGKALNAE
jgi:hypothetical protein